MYDMLGVKHYFNPQSAAAMKSLVVKRSESNEQKFELKVGQNLINNKILKHSMLLEQKSKADEGSEEEVVTDIATIFESESQVFGNNKVIRAQVSILPERRIYEGKVAESTVFGIPVTYSDE